MQRKSKRNHGLRPGTILTIVNPPLERPTVRTPDPVRKGVVDERRPAKHPDHGGQDSGSLACGTEDDGGDETGEHHLVGGEDLRERSEHSVKRAGRGEA
jgi:hypothetical protein